MGRRGRDRMVVGLTTTCATLCDKVVNDLRRRRVGSFLPIFSNNEIDSDDITEILLKVALNTSQTCI